MEIWCLFAATFCEKEDFCNSSLVYCWRLYGSLWKKITRLFLNFWKILHQQHFISHITKALNKGNFFKQIKLEKFKSIWRVLCHQCTQLSNTNSILWHTKKSNLNLWNLNFLSLWGPWFSSYVCYVTLPFPLFSCILSHFII